MNNFKMKDRNYTLDILKIIALVCIILAHINPASVVFQIRNFDVPLMIIISVILSVDYINNKNFKYIPYILKRIKRLVIPTWIFLSIYFFINFILGNMYSLKTILVSYLLIGGMGYIWIIRIYIYVAIVSPIVNWLQNRLKRWQYILFFILHYFLYTLVIEYTQGFEGIAKILINVTVIDFIGYTFIVAVAIFISNLNNKNKFITGLIWGVLFIVLAFKYKFTQTQAFKYPLRLYYLSYAFSISLILYAVIDEIIIRFKFKINRGVIYISNNSLWIYLWHIIYIPIINKLFLEINFGYILRCILIVIISVCTVLCQNKINLVLKNLKSRKFKAVDYKE